MFDGQIVAPIELPDSDADSDEVEDEDMEEPEGDLDVQTDSDTENDEPVKPSGRVSQDCLFDDEDTDTDDGPVPWVKV